MNYSIKTAERFKLPIAVQSRTWDLGPENVIARMAFSLSLEMPDPIDINNLEDTKGKEYPVKVLFGELQSVYEGMLCLREEISNTHPDFKRFVKGHVDRGLELLLSHAGMDLSQVVELYAPVEVPSVE
jgi:DNA sulfur modification protein DndE